MAGYHSNYDTDSKDSVTNATSVVSPLGQPSVPTLFPSYELDDSTIKAVIRAFKVESGSQQKLMRGAYSIPAAVGSLATLEIQNPASLDVPIRALSITAEQAVRYLQDGFHLYTKPASPTSRCEVLDLPTFTSGLDSHPKLSNLMLTNHVTGIQLWRMSKSEKQWRSKDISRPGLSVPLFSTFHPSGNYVCTMDNECLQLFDLNHSQSICPIKWDFQKTEGARIASAEIAPDGAILSVGTTTGQMQLYDLRTNLSVIRILPSTPTDVTPITEMRFALDLSLLTYIHRRGMMAYDLRRCCTFLPLPTSAVLDEKRSSVVAVTGSGSCMERVTYMQWFHEQLLVSLHLEEGVHPIVSLDLNKGQCGSQMHDSAIQAVAVSNTSVITGHYNGKVKCTKLISAMVPKLSRKKQVLAVPLSTLKQEVSKTALLELPSVKLETALVM